MHGTAWLLRSGSSVEVMVWLDKTSPDDFRAFVYSQLDAPYKRHLAT